MLCRMSVDEFLKKMQKCVFIKYKVNSILPSFSGACVCTLTNVYLIRDHMANNLLVKQAHYVMIWSP